MNLCDVPVSATLSEAAKWLRYSERKVWTMGKHGEILRSESGRSVRYDVRDYVERQRRGKDNDDGQRGE
jgi:hypothetical protein